MSGDGKQGTHRSKAGSSKPAHMGSLAQPGGELSRMVVSGGDTSAPICLLFAQISTDPQLFVSAPNSFLGELTPCLRSAGSRQPGPQTG